MAQIYGLDVSNWQQTVDWAAVFGAGYRFAFAKASESTTYTDPYFAANWTGIKAAGMIRGAYHYAQPDRGSPEAEAAHFVAVVRAAGIEQYDLVALDIETGTGDLSQWVTTWLNTVKAALGFPPLIYTAASFMDAHNLNGVSAATNCGLWLASWGDVAPKPTNPQEFTAFWQNSASATVPGVHGPCDVDLFLSDLPTLRKYGAPARPVPPVDPRDAEIARLQAEVVDLTAARDAAYKRIESGLAAVQPLVSALQGVSG